MNFGGVIRLNKTGLCLLLVILGVFCIYMWSSSGNGASNVSKINLKILLKVAIEAAETGGVQVVATKDNISIKNKGLTREGMNDSVTTADFLSHCSMLGTLKKAYPDLNVISEEAKTKCDQDKQDSRKFDDSTIAQLPDYFESVEDITVWIDPLDATHEYTEKLYEYVTTMVCVAVRGQPIIGVIHKPFSLETSWAWAGHDTSANLKNSNSAKGDKLKITISRSHSGKIREILDKNFKNYYLIEAAGAGYKVLEVANGNVDAYLHVTAIKKWDICAGNAIISSVGGKMTTKFGRIIDYTDMTNVQNEDGLVATLKGHDLFIGKLGGIWRNISKKVPVPAEDVVYLYN